MRSAVREPVMKSFPEADREMANHAFNIAESLSTEERAEFSVAYLIMVYGKLLDVQQDLEKLNTSRESGCVDS